MKMMKIYARLCNGIEKIFKICVIALLVFIVIIVFAETIIRYVFHSSLKVTEDIVLFCIPWMVFIGGAIGLRSRQLVSIDAMGKLHPRAKKILLFTSNILVAVFLIFVTQSGLAYAFNNIHQKSTALRVSMIIPYLSVPVGCGAMTLFTFEEILKNFWGVENNKEGGREHVV